MTVFCSVFVMAPSSTFVGNPGMKEVIEGGGNISCCNGLDEITSLYESACLGLNLCFLLGIVGASVKGIA